MTFGPPLSRWERRAIWLWLMTSGAAAAAMVLGVFWWWIVLIVTVPFVFAAYYAPTLWLYLTPALLIWLTLRRWPLAAVLSASAAIATIAVGVPAILNRHLEAQARAAVASDHGKPVEVGAAGGTIAWLGGDEEYCSDECLRFLITGRAKAVLLGPALQGLPDPDRDYLRIHLVPWSDDRGCPLPAGVEKIVYVQHLRLIDPDQCVAFDRVPLATARLVFNVDLYPQGVRDDRLPSLRPQLKRVEAYQWQSLRPKLVFRRTDASAPSVGMPLSLWPYNGADTSSPAQWRSDGEIRAGRPLGVDRMAVVADRLYVPAFDSPR